ncbi:hypothetical protein [Brumimicrobium mesophilum]|uniref:hypothetical protein n=1 Tax=Brumimicrobium mesophilum TaxID=392717 RepID=UPI000D1401EE|nr:hypothetical protein [Brumimicrobium mesophilum]
MKEKNISKNYPFNAWSLTVCTGPLLWLIYHILFNEGFGWVDFQYLPVFIFFGVLFSLPWLVLYVLLFKFLTKKIMSSYLTKGILSIAGVLGILITFKLINGALANEFTMFYCSSFLISTWIVNFTKGEKEFEINT